jgi:hypothetical protein
MAQLWFSLAQHAEEQEAQFLGKSALPRSQKDKGDENGHPSGDGDEGGR